MSDDFDPYFEWLGIEPHEMPADHYRLLGLAQFESSPITIAAAADERMTLVRTYQTGPRAAYTQQLLNELAAAKICLLHPGSKASYDQLIQAVITSELPPSLPPLEAPASEPSDEFVVYDTDEPEESGRNTWIAVAAMLLMLTAGAALLAVVYQHSNRDNATGPAYQQYPSLPAIDGPNDGTDDDGEPILVYQEADGSINLDASVASLRGPTLMLGTSGSVNVISNWQSMDDTAAWKFKVVKVPPQGIFQVNVTYAARPEADGGSFVIVIGDKEKECEIRGEGQAVTDEHFIAVPASGDYVLTVRAKSKPSERLMTLKSVTLLFP